MIKATKMIVPVVAAVCAVSSLSFRTDAMTNNEVPIMEQTAKYEVNSSLWQSLSSDKQSTLRSLFSKKAAIDAEIVSKYKSYGIIDEKKASHLAEKLEEMTKQTPRMPFIGRNHKGK